MPGTAGVAGQVGGGRPGQAAAEAAAGKSDSDKADEQGAGRGCAGAGQVGEAGCIFWYTASVSRHLGRAGWARPADNE